MGELSLQAMCSLFTLKEKKLQIVGSSNSAWNRIQFNIPTTIVGWKSYSIFLKIPQNYVAVLEGSMVAVIES